jgi:hypothetical protein
VVDAGVEWTDEEVDEEVGGDAPPAGACHALLEMHVWW